MGLVKGVSDARREIYWAKPLGGLSVISLRSKTNCRINM
jgi:hypothetical protein